MNYSFLMEESHVSNAIMERKILYPGKTSTLIKDCSAETKVSKEIDRRGL